MVTVTEISAKNQKTIAKSAHFEFREDLFVPKIKKIFSCRVTVPEIPLKNCLFFYIEEEFNFG